MARPAPDIAALRKPLLRWYRKNRRDLLWRRTSDPYVVLLSEVMLQQTQVRRVSALLPRFLERFPTPGALASAPRSEVVRRWKGMGYNNRAVRLHMAVREIESRYGGTVPARPEQLETLPGIGRYTARAVACFAHGARVPVVDVNVRRVLSRITARMTSPSSALPERRAWEIAARVLPRDAYTWNQALMELGSTVCRARAPLCPACPVRAHCPSGGLHARRESPAKPVRRPEPSFAGVPRRIWRGRVIDALRRRRRGLTTAEVRRRVMLPDDAGAGRFLDDVVRRLTADGVLRVRQSGTKTVLCLAP